MDHKAVKILKVATLLAIITIFFATSPRLISSQITENLQSNEKALSDVSNGLNEKYLRMFNFTTATLIQNDLKSSGNMATSKSNYAVVSNGRKVEVEIVSTINIRHDVMTGYEYRGRFSSGDLLNCFVYESTSKVTKGNRVITNMKQTIKGTYNYELLATEEKVLGNTLTKQVNVRLLLSNSSGNYFLNVKGNLELTSDESSILSGNITLDQNFFAPVGQYLVKLEQAPNITKIGKQLNVSTAAKATVTMPDGKIIDPLIFDWVDFSWWGAMLTGFAIAWTPFETVTIGLILTIAGAIIAMLTLVGITVFIVGLIFDVAGFYQSSWEYTIMYFEMIQIIWINLIPVYGEMGYYTDRILTPWGYQYIGWTFLPLSPGNLGPHTGIWPNWFG